MTLQVQHINKSFGSEKVLQDISFELKEFSTMSILGKSGCGKTTLLKILAGILHEDQGDIILDGKKINSVAPNKRDIAYLYQEPLLFPHLDVFKNIAFGLHIRKYEKNTITERTEKLIGELQLNGHEYKMPEQLSGGQKQRVAFGRAIIVNPKVLLLDEPFGNLDTDTRSNMQQLFKSLVAEHHITTLFVTHDLKEAVVTGDTYSYMKNGTLKVYKDLQQFADDEDTGIQQEMHFWNTIKK